MIEVFLGEQEAHSCYADHRDQLQKSLCRFIQQVKP